MKDNGNVATDVQGKEGHSNLSLTLPEKGILSLINRKEIADRVRQKQDLRKKILAEIAEARKVSVELTNQIVSIEHFFVAGDKEFVETVKNDPDNPAMKAYYAILDILRKHLQNGCAKKSGNSFSVGYANHYCVIPSRLAAMSSLFQLTIPHPQGDGEELRALTFQEIGRIAINIGLKKSNDHRIFTIGPISDEEQAEFDQHMERILNACKKVEVERQKQLRKSLSNQTTVRAIEDALQRGGIYLATIPDEQLDKKTFFGGQVLLCFDRKRKVVSIGGEYGQQFVDGNEYFCKAVMEIEKQNPEISFEDVLSLLKEDRDEPNGRRQKHDYRLWQSVRKHINWLRICRKEENLISSMTQNNDLTIQNFLDGELGNIVLRLDSFGMRKETVSPAAIRISRVLVGKNKALRVIEANPGMMSIVSNLIGEEKVFPENNLPLVLNKFVGHWKQSHSAE